MDITPNLQLPYIMAAQAQKHVTHNEAIRVLDAILQICVIDRDLAAPPASPADGSRYIVALGATGVWTGQDHKVAAFQDGAWMYYVPREGWIAWVADEDELVAWDGAGWVIAGGNSASAIALNPATGGMVGVNTTADATNRLAAATNAVLFTHDNVTPGSGDMRQVLNKAAVGNTVSQLYQSNWSGRAETGLTGDNDFHVKVSADGSTWREAIVVDRNDGRIAVQGLKSMVANNAGIGQLIMTPGGSQQTTIWRIDATRTGLPRTATIASVAGDKITLSTGVAPKFFQNAFMLNVSYVRIWNTSKTPAQSAWIRAAGTSTELFVRTAANIAGWLAGETIRIGEPGSGDITKCAAVDVSQMLQNRIGAVFRQSGLWVAMTVSTSGSGGFNAQIGVTPDASGGSFANIYAGENGVGYLGGITQSSFPVGLTQLSPISNSNLLFIREQDDGSGILEVGDVKAMAVIV